MRLFFAVELSRDVQSALGKLRPPDGVAWARDYRWVEPESMHITLAFLGEQPPDALATLRRIGTQAAGSSRAGTLTIGGAGAFGPRRAPRVLWVGLQGDLRPLEELQAQLASNVRGSGFRLEEDRAFSPHITLARRRTVADSGVPPAWPPSRPPGPLRVPLQYLTLFQSQLRPSGSRYTALDRFPVGA